jgi:hypothetical protein
VCALSDAEGRFDTPDTPLPACEVKFRLGRLAMRGGLPKANRGGFEKPLVDAMSRPDFGILSGPGGVPERCPDSCPDNVIFGRYPAGLHR